MLTLYLPCVILICVGFFRVLISLEVIGEKAGWLPVRAWCCSLGAPVKANTPQTLGWCVRGLSLSSSRTLKVKKKLQALTYCF